MKLIRFAILFGLLFALVCTSNAQEQTAPFTYHANRKDFERYLQDLHKRKQVGDEHSLGAMFQAAVLPNHDVWFRENFGASLGAKLSHHYAKHRGEVAPFLSQTLAEVLRRNLKEIRVFELESDHPVLGADFPGQTRIGLRARRRVKLFSAMYSAKQKSKQEAAAWVGVSYFVYAEGAFRFVGNLEPELDEPSTGSDQETPARQPVRIRVGGNVQQARLLRTVFPVYPPLAKQARIQGTVQFQVIISREGDVKKAEVLKGHPLLVQAALDAVRGWICEPTLLDGQAIEVVTTINVVFTLGG
ncbi:MAG: energy transducer TonB [Acidobacteria bacterium]|nr:energy transducer TonB [Acidobacteriota bacterium]MBI3663899.1 energy transducer TonB [Acidobacteriota bacterium]